MRTALNLYEQAKMSERLVNASRAERCVKDHTTDFGRVAVCASRFHERIARLHVFTERGRACGRNRRTGSIRRHGRGGWMIRRNGRLRAVRRNRRAGRVRRTGNCRAARGALVGWWRENIAFVRHHAAGNPSLREHCHFRDIRHRHPAPSAGEAISSVWIGRVVIGATRRRRRTTGRQRHCHSGERDYL